MKPLPNRIFAPEPNSKKTDFALLILRLCLGLTMLFAHGLGKLTNFGEMSGKFLDLFGIGSKASLGMAVFAEFFCSALLVLGLLTRFAALNLVVTMLVAFGMVHKWALAGGNSGEIAFIYLAGYLVLLLAGPGRFSADGALFAKPTRPATGPVN